MISQPIYGSLGDGVFTLKSGQNLVSLEGLIAELASKVCGLEFSGVDLIIDETGQPYVLVY